MTRLSELSLSFLFPGIKEILTSSLKHSANAFLSSMPNNRFLKSAPVFRQRGNLALGVGNFVTPQPLLGFIFVVRDSWDKPVLWITLYNAVDSHLIDIKAFPLKHLKHFAQVHGSLNHFQDLEDGLSFFFELFPHDLFLLVTHRR